MADVIVTDKCPAAGGHAAKRELPETVIDGNICHAIAGIPYLIENSWAAMMAPVLEGGKPYWGNGTAAMVQVIINEAVLKNYIQYSSKSAEDKLSTI